MRVSVVAVVVVTTAERPKFNSIETLFAVVAAVAAVARSTLHSICKNSFKFFFGLKN